jgi:hypothetical protein
MSSVAQHSASSNNVGPPFPAAKRRSASEDGSFSACSSFHTPPSTPPTVSPRTQSPLTGKSTASGSRWHPTHSPRVPIAPLCGQALANRGRPPLRPHNGSTTHLDSLAAPVAPPSNAYAAALSGVRPVPDAVAMLLSLRSGDTAIVQGDGDSVPREVNVAPMPSPFDADGPDPGDPASTATRNRILDAHMQRMADCTAAAQPAASQRGGLPVFSAVAAAPSPERSLSDADLQFVSMTSAVAMASDNDKDDGSSTGSLMSLPLSQQWHGLTPTPLVPSASASSLREAGDDLFSKDEGHGTRRPSSGSLSDEHREAGECTLVFQPHTTSVLAKEGSLATMAPPSQAPLQASLQQAALLSAFRASTGSRSSHSSIDSAMRSTSRRGSPVLSASALSYDLGGPLRSEQSFLGSRSSLAQGSCVVDNLTQQDSETASGLLRRMMSTGDEQRESTAARLAAFGVKENEVEDFMTKLKVENGIDRTYTEECIFEGLSMWETHLAGDKKQAAPRPRPVPEADTLLSLTTHMHSRSALPLLTTSDATPTAGPGTTWSAPCQREPPCRTNSAAAALAQRSSPTHSPTPSTLSAPKAEVPRTLRPSGSAAALLAVDPLPTTVRALPPLPPLHVTSSDASTTAAAAPPAGAPASALPTPFASVALLQPMQSQDGSGSAGPQGDPHASTATATLPSASSLPHVRMGHHHRMTSSSQLGDFPPVPPPPRDLGRSLSALTGCKFHVIPGEGMAGVSPLAPALLLECRSCLRPHACAPNSSS